MFRGRRSTSPRTGPVLHVALRAPRDASIVVDGKNVVPGVHAVLDRMAAFASRVAAASGRAIPASASGTSSTSASGGSDLGPVMAYEALRHYSERSLTFRFVSNVDASTVRSTRDLDPAETLFIVSSKTFTTMETMTNAQSARDWSLEGLGGDVNAGGQALRRRLDQCREGVRFGIDTANMFEFWDWVGGRYSMDSAIVCPR